MIVVDTGPVVAMINRRDKWHKQCAHLLTTTPEPLLLPEPLLTEIGYLLATRCGPHVEGEFLRDTVEGAFDVVCLDHEDRARMADLVDTYADLPLGTADAAVLAVAERHSVRQVATLDRRHFTVVRARHVDALTLLPA